MFSFCILSSLPPLIGFGTEQQKQLCNVLVGYTWLSGLSTVTVESTLSYLNVSRLYYMLVFCVVGLLESIFFMWCDNRVPSYSQTFR